MPATYEIRIVSALATLISLSSGSAFTNGAPSKASERTAHYPWTLQRCSGRMAFVCCCTKHLHPLGPRVLVCSTACLPDERHITSQRSGTGVVDTDRVCAGHLDVHQVGVIDEHDVGPCCAGTAPTGDGRAVRPFQANQCSEVSWSCM